MPETTWIACKHEGGRRDCSAPQCCSHRAWQADRITFRLLNRDRGRRRKLMKAGADR